MIFFCDHLQTPSLCKNTGNSGSGDAYDRELTEIGININGATVLNQSANQTELKISPTEAVANTTLSFDDDSIANFIPTTIDSPEQILTLQPMAVGQSSLTGINETSLAGGITPTQAAAATLNVYVFPALPTYQINFFLVYDTINGGHSPGPGITPTSIQSMISGLSTQIQQNVNSIWGQVNISFSVLAVQSSTVAFDSSVSRICTQNSTDFTAIQSIPASLAYPINVFFMNGFNSVCQDDGVTSTRTACNGKTKVSQGWSVIRTYDENGQISTTKLAATLAHELGHQLGLTPTSVYRGTPLNVDSTDLTLSYRLLEPEPNGLTITPLERSCIMDVTE